jgi:hypothetical protein
VASATARTLAFYAAKSGDKAAQKLAKELLDRMWNKYRDKLGVTTPETRVDYKRFNDAVHVPAGWTGKMPNGDPIQSGATFISLRSKYRSDPEWPKVEAYLKGGKPPVFRYHRLWAQADIAIANASYGWLFPDDKGAAVVARRVRAVSRGHRQRGRGREKGLDGRTRLGRRSRSNDGTRKDRRDAFWLFRRQEPRIRDHHAEDPVSVDQLSRV